MFHYISNISPYALARNRVHEIGLIDPKSEKR